MNGCSESSHDGICLLNMDFGMAFHWMLASSLETKRFWHTSICFSFHVIFLLLAVSYLHGTIPENPQGIVAPGKGLASWWTRGAENDAAWRALSLKDKAFYEIGKKTLPSSTFSKYANLDPVARGRALVSDIGWRRALTPEGTGWRLGAGTTLSTGPTPLTRWFVPRAGITGGIGAGGYFGWQWLFGSDEEGQQ